MNLRNLTNGHADLGSRIMSAEPTIPHGYRLVSGPHTAAEVEEGWTITAEWLKWNAGPGAIHHEDWLCLIWGTRRRSFLCPSNDPDRDIYRIEKVTP